MWMTVQLRDQQVSAFVPFNRHTQARGLVLDEGPLEAGIENDRLDITVKLDLPVNVRLDVVIQHTTFLGFDQISQSSLVPGVGQPHQIVASCRTEITGVEGRVRKTERRPIQDRLGEPQVG